MARVIIISTDKTTCYLHFQSAMTFLGEKSDDKLRHSAHVPKLILRLIFQNVWAALWFIIDGLKSKSFTCVNDNSVVQPRTMKRPTMGARAGFCREIEMNPYGLVNALRFS